ncbi:hypothetical protein [Breoghania sp.]|uniref:hypothetical protein n=1 Tax=Breoghania sp. TaxID=2065378 RepID=UPI0026084702|nr:hypothetical protein [Breoghania sp.]MDJ0933382.1 hypothetical protein [Breoghania sp.]
MSSHPGAIEIDDPGMLTNQVLQHRQDFSNFLICGLSCLVVFGGFTRRILLDPRRPDKKQLGLVFRGVDAQVAATDMLRSLLPTTDMALVPSAEVYSSKADPSQVDSFLASHMFHRWLVDIATCETVDQVPECTNNVGTSALLPAFGGNPVMYERCLKSAIDLHKEDYLHAVRKAGHLAGIVDRDSFEEALWEAGRLFEAVLLCENPKLGHSLADPDLRDYIAGVYRNERPDGAISIRTSWLHDEEILALVALDLLDPGRRMACPALDDGQSFPQIALGRLAKAIWSHAIAAPAEPILLSPGG